MNEQNVRLAFDKFDTDCAGTVTPQRFAKCLLSTLDLTQEESLTIFKEVDVANAGSLTYGKLFYLHFYSKWQQFAVAYRAYSSEFAYHESIHARNTFYLI